MSTAEEIIEKYGKMSHMDAFIIAQEEYELDDQVAMWVADDVYRILHPTPITRMKDWRNECWEREDFKRLRELAIKTNCDVYTCKNNHQLILVHYRIDGNRPYKEVLSEINEISNFKYKLWDREATPGELDEWKIERNDELKKILPTPDDFNKYYILSNGNTEYLISYYDIKDVQKVKL